MYDVVINSIVLYRVLESDPSEISCQTPMQLSSSSKLNVNSRVLHALYMLIPPQKKVLSV